VCSVLRNHGKFKGLPTGRCEELANFVKVKVNRYGTEDRPVNLAQVFRTVIAYAGMQQGN